VRGGRFTSIIIADAIWKFKHKTATFGNFSIAILFCERAFVEFTKEQYYRIIHNTFPSYIRNLYGIHAHIPVKTELAFAQIIFALLKKIFRSPHFFHPSPYFPSKLLQMFAIFPCIFRFFAALPSAKLI